MYLRQFIAILVVVVTCLLAERTVRATVLVPMSDADMVQSSSVIVTGEVSGIESVELSGRGIVTRITLAVEQTVKGLIAGDRVVITEPGGQVGDRTVRVFGAPEFTVGERVLVFLWLGNDGTLRTNGLALGKYHIATGALGSQRALRSAPSLDVRRLDDFMKKLRALARGKMLEAHVPSEPTGTNDLIDALLAVERFGFLGEEPSRWFEPDQGDPVGFLLANDEDSLGSEGTKTVLADALATWTNVSSASIVLVNAGSTSPAQSVGVFGVCDGDSTIQFNDPFGGVGPDINPIDCTGVFAIGGYCARQETKKLGGTAFHRISEGDLTVNDNIGACLGAVDITETVAHEIGHTIGLDHSLDPDALMYQFAHHDGRGAELTQDDILGVSALYPELDMDGDGIPDARDRCPSTPPGFVIDKEGCACTEPGSAGCDDDDLCTEDSCNNTTGACVNDPMDCGDGDPCTIDCCIPATGQCVSELRDSDADGVCDPLDNCPLQPDADPTDLNGDGVGDVCQCADEKPGRCVPGRGWKARRCLVEWMPALTPRLTGRRLPAIRQRCTDGDPECDDDEVPGQCTFELALCLGSDDPRLNKCKQFTVDHLLLKSPNPKRLTDAVDIANAGVLGAAIEAIGSSGPGTHGCGRVPAVRCSEMMPIVVPTRGLRRGSKRLKIVAVAEDDRRGSAKLKLFCKPADE